MNVNFNLVGLVAAAQTGAAKDASFEQVIAAVEKNLNLDDFSSELEIAYSKGGKVWTAHLHSSSEGSGLKIAEFYGRQDLVYRRKGEQFSQRNKGATQFFALGEEASKAGVFQTDYSFKDVLELTRLTADYNRVVFEKSNLDGKSCYHIVLKAKPGKNPFYDKREMWVDPQTMVPVRMDVFGSTGQKLKTISVTKTQLFKGINYPVEITVKSALRETETRIAIMNLRTLEQGKILKYRD